MTRLVMTEAFTPSETPAWRNRSCNTLTVQPIFSCIPKVKKERFRNGILFNVHIKSCTVKIGILPVIMHLRDDFEDFHVLFVLSLILFYKNNIFIDITETLCYTLITYLGYHLIKKSVRFVKIGILPVIMHLRDDFEDFHVPIENGFDQNSGKAFSVNRNQSDFVLTIPI